MDGVAQWMTWRSKNTVQEKLIYCAVSADSSSWNTPQKCLSFKISCIWNTSWCFVSGQVDLPATLLWQNRKTKINHTHFLTVQVTNEIKRGRATQGGWQKLLAKKVSLAPSDKAISHWANVCIRQYQQYLNAFSSNLSECLIMAHYFKDIFLLYSTNITAR